MTELEQKIIAMGAVILDNHCLEDLMVAIINLKTADGKKLQLDPKIVLQHWVAYQMPSPPQALENIKWRGL